MRQSFYEFLDEYRISEAKRLLARRPDLTIIHISHVCGYSSKATFNRKFKTWVGISPQAYRRQYEEQQWERSD